MTNSLSIRGPFAYNKSKSKIFSSDSFRFILLLIITLILKKISPSIIFSGFLFYTLFLFYRSKKDWFYLLYALVLTYDVGGILGYNGYTIINAKPFILMYFDVFSIVAFIKTLNRKPGYFISKMPLKVWLFYGLFLTGYGLAVFGAKDFGGNTGLRYYWYLFRLIISLLFLFSIPRLLNKKEDIIKLSEVLFILIFINLAGQAFYLIVGKPIFVYFAGVNTGESSFLHSLGENVFVNTYTMRPEYGSNLRFIALFLSVYFYYQKEKTFNRTYLLIVIITILFSTFITATRGWILSFSFFLLLSTFFSRKGAKFIKIYVLGIVFIVSALSFSPALRLQVVKSWDRLTTLENLVEGDVTARGTNRRLTDRSWPVMKVFYENPIVGVGISGLGMNTSDHHVGNQTILMGGGIIEMLIFLWFIFSFIVKIYRYNVKLYNYHLGYRGHLILIIFSFLSLLIIHSSSQGLFGWLIYAVHPEKILFIVLLFVIYNIIIIENLKLYARKNK